MPFGLAASLTGEHTQWRNLMTTTRIMSGDLEYPGVSAAATHPHYERAPVVEAVAGFGIPELADDRKPLLEVLARVLRDTYPIAEPVDGSGAGPGFRLSSSDGKRYVRASFGGHSLSQLAPYDRWEPFIAEFRRTWNAYLTVLGEVAIDRFFIRYYNELPIPIGVPLHHYFNIYPAMPDRDILFDNIYLVVDTSVENPPARVQTRMSPMRLEGGTVKMILDNTFTFRMADHEAVWDKLEIIRKLKNDTFESQITDAMREALANEGGQ